MKVSNTALFNSISEKRMQKIADCFPKSFSKHVNTLVLGHSMEEPGIQEPGVRFHFQSSALHFDWAKANPTPEELGRALELVIVALSIISEKGKLPHEISIRVWKKHRDIQSELIDETYNNFLREAAKSS